MDNVSQYENFCMIQFFKINSSYVSLNKIEWKSFPELHLYVNDGKCTITHKFDIENNKELETTEFIEISIESNVKTMKAVAIEAVGITDYKRTISSIIDESSIDSQKLKEFIKHFNNPDWFFVYSGFTKTKSNAEKSTDNNNYEITLTKSTVVSTVVPDNKLYISKNTDDCHSVAMFNNTYFAKKTKSKIKHNVNNTESIGSSGGKRNPDRERIYKLPIHKRRTDNYYNYE